MKYLIIVYNDCFITERFVQAMCGKRGSILGAVLQLLQTTENWKTSADDRLACLGLRVLAAACHECPNFLLDNMDNKGRWQLDILFGKLVGLVTRSSLNVSTVKSVQSGHNGDQIVSVYDNLPFRTDCFDRKCVVEGQKQTDRIR
jgi:hypothetical protein